MISSRKLNKLGLAAGTALSASLLSVSLTPQKAQAIVTITGVETGGNLVFTYTGKINTTGLGSPVSDGLASNGAIVPSAGIIGFATTVIGSQAYRNLSIAGPTSFGTGGVNISGIVAGGSQQFAIALGGFPGVPAIYTNSGYVSGSQIDGSFTFTSATFASVGIDNSQNYVWTLNANNDQIRLNVATPVPLESDAAPILGSVAFMGVGVWWKRRRAQAKADLSLGK